MINAKEAIKLTMQSAEIIHDTNCKLAEEAIRAACDKGKTFAEILTLDESTVTLLIEKGFLVWESTMYINFQGLNKPVPAFKISW